MEGYHDALTLVRELRPEHPVLCFRPHAAERAARWFVDSFPGKVLYATKANPMPALLDVLWDEGVRAFDVASVAEVALVAERYPGAELAFNHPVKSRSAIRTAYFDYGVRTFAVDTLEELDKIDEITGSAKDLTILVRLAVDNPHSSFPLMRKFGVSKKEAPELLRAARKLAARVGTSFHVGSQNMRPEAFEDALKYAGDIVRASGVTLDIVNVGGGFPSVYPGLVPPALDLFMQAIERGLDHIPAVSTSELWSEPGRALCAESGSMIVRVELRKGTQLYLNDGTYGSLFDAGTPKWVFPVRRLRVEGESGPAPLVPFSFYGPTCDSIDFMPGPFLLPNDVREGDYIEIGMLGAYSVSMRTAFNGFGHQDVAIVNDPPLLSLYDLDPVQLPVARPANRAWEMRSK
jgi:ornithine decarboxylase